MQGSNRNKAVCLLLKSIRINIWWRRINHHIEIIMITIRKFYHIKRKDTEINKKNIIEEKCPKDNMQNY
jgi:hypothetical protein